MNPLVNDELDDVMTAQANAAQRDQLEKSVSPEMNSVMTVSSADSTDDEVFDFGDQKYKSVPKLPRIKPEKGHVCRFFLVNGMKARAKDTHYIEGKGTYLCLGENCPACVKGCAKSTRLVALAVKYSNADAISGRLGTHKPTYEMGYVLLSRANYSQMLSVLPEDGTPQAVDWKIAHAARAFGYEFSVLSTTAAYLKVGDKQVIADLVAEFMDGVELQKKLGKRATAMELKLALAGEAAHDANAGASLDDLEY